VKCGSVFKSKRFPVSVGKCIDYDVLSVDRITDQEPEHEHAVENDNPALTKIGFGIFGL
jgi:hypothetical protein